MSSAVKILPHYTYEDYRIWEGRWELIEGIPYSMSPSPVPGHQSAAGKFFFMFTQELIQKKCTCKAYLPLDYHLSDDTILQPDVLIVCKPVTKKYLDFPPALVVEVLSPATAMKDRNSKFYLYESQKIPYYLIVDADKQEVEIYKLNSEGKYILEKADPALPYTFTFDGDSSADLIPNNIWD
jgi:Uma2 family endonuclease